jgi:protein arginine N-methyltransferase 1
LSFFAAQAGAAKVFAVERSDMASVAQQIAADNNLNETVSVVHGLVEEVVLPVESVDIIISEWIGTFLVHESMLDSVIFARDKWLAPGGLLLPDRATLYLAGAEDQAEQTTSWDSFYGLDFSALGSAYRQVAAQQCLFRNSLATQHAVLLELDLYTASVSEQEFSVPFQLLPLDSQSRNVHILVSWFVLEFFTSPQGSRGSVAVNHSTLSTHPDEPCTHWQQTVFALAKPMPLQADGTLKGQAKVQRASWSARDLKVELTIGAAAESFVIVGAEL